MAQLANLVSLANLLSMFFNTTIRILVYIFSSIDETGLSNQQLGR